MLWIPFALFSALVLASRRTYEKNLTKSFGNFTIGFIVQAFALLPTLALFPFFPLPNDIVHLPWQFWWPLLIIWFIIYPLQTYCLYRGLREGELSHVTQLMALVPIFNMVISFILLKEVPTIPVLLGIVIIVFGTYLILMNDDHRHQEARYNKAALFIILSTLCVAIGSTLDKISITASTPVFYSFMNTLGGTVVLLGATYIAKQRSDLSKIKTMVGPFTLLGIFQALSYTASMLAFSYGPTAYVLAVRSSSFLFAGLFGIILLKERLTVHKMVSLGLFVIGIVLITFARS